MCSRCHTLKHSRVGQKAGEGLGQTGVWDQILPVNHPLHFAHSGARMGAGYRDERVWFEDKNFSHSTIHPSISVPKQSLMGRGSAHSSLSSAQAMFLRSVLSGSLEGGQR